MKFELSLLRRFALLVTLSFAVGCTPPADESEAHVEGASKPYQIVCTVGMITDIVRNVAGELIGICFTDRNLLFGGVAAGGEG
jgi:ABC-type Zn uptake system ZnuABC Zn-binding protein ZnuA